MPRVWDIVTEDYEERSNIGRVIFWVIIIGLILVCVITNPTLSNFANWGSNSVTNNQSIITKFMVSFFSKPIIENIANRNNYIVFSIYTIEYERGASIKTLGILGKNFPLNYKVQDGTIYIY